MHKFLTSEVDRSVTERGRCSIVRFLLHLIIIASLFIWMLACDEDSKPAVRRSFRVIYCSGGFVFSPFGPMPDVVLVQFSTKVASVNMMINGASVDAFTDDNKTYTIPADLIVEAILGDVDYECINSGTFSFPFPPFTLTIEAEDETGRSLEGYTVDCTIGMYDLWPPTICGSKCIPRNGAVDVDPDVYPEKLVIAFNEPVVGAIVKSMEPRFDFVNNLTEDGMKLEIRFVNYALSYATEYKVEISAADAGGNPLVSDQYSFTTVSKEE